MSVCAKKSSSVAMPACTSESLTGMWPSNESLNASGSVSSGFHSPGSPVSLSPISTSPENTLKRRVPIRRANSTNSCGSTGSGSFVIRSDHRDSRSQSPLNFPPEEPPRSPLVDLIGWYPLFLLKVAKALMMSMLPATWKQLVFAIPMFWISMWVWCFWQLVQLPLNVFKLALSLVLTSPSERIRKKRTVLISGGSTIQALHLARNFYSAGARVVVCEVEGNFALARFSTAVSKFYTVPRPNSEKQQNYVRALCEIVNKENAVYYIPVSAATPAYFDAVAKPHLELLGCTCFAPGIKEVRALDDILEVFKRCQKSNMPVPPFYTLTSRDELGGLYDTGVVRPEQRFVMSMAGACGIRDRAKLVLPPCKRQLRLPPSMDISEQRPWVVVQDVEGEHFVTCTTVKESKIIANVSCRLDRHNNGLLPVESKEIDAWLLQFFGQLHLLRPITGHVSFRLVKCAHTGHVLPLSARVGVSLPYICYTSVHPRLLWKPCKHFSRQNSGPLVAENGRYYMPETVIDALKHPSVEAVTRLVGTVLDKREALFAVWDPLPYCAYYHMQLPFRNFLGFLQRTQGGTHFPPPMTAN